MLRSASQAIWALAKLRRTDKPTLDALVKAAKGKAGESPVDAAALAWSLGFLSECLYSNFTHQPSLPPLPHLPFHVNVNSLNSPLMPSRRLQGC